MWELDLPNLSSRSDFDLNNRSKCHKDRYMRSLCKSFSMGTPMSMGRGSLKGGTLNSNAKLKLKSEINYRLYGHLVKKMISGHLSHDLLWKSGCANGLKSNSTEGLIILITQSFSCHA